MPDILNGDVAITIEAACGIVLASKLFLVANNATIIMIDRDIIILVI